MIKKHFPLFKNYPNLIYLDNAATTHKPLVMLEALSEYYSLFNSNIGRGAYDLAQKSEQCYMDSKKIVADFLNVNSHNIIYTSGSTESINLASYIANQHRNKNKKYIILPISEHHANVLIWQKLAQDNNLEPYWISDPLLIANPEQINAEILEQAAIFTIAQVSNVTGEVFPVDKWCSLAKKLNSISIVDGAQGITSLTIDLNQIDCDFYVFSAHKLYGPMGLGILYIKDKFLNSQPLKLGGGIIEDVDLYSHEYIEESNKFEAGTPNVSNAYAFSKTLQFLQMNNWKELLNYTHELGVYLDEQLNSINVKKVLLGGFPTTHISSFVFPNIHSHDVGTFLANKNMAVRVGKHCAYPLHKHLNVNSSVRASLGIYNTKEDVDNLIKTLKECIDFFGEKL
jgi:cysteine desulfurase/selenocysteine lyase